MNTPTIREMAEQHPGSAWQSLVNYANWTKNLSISRTAQRLTHLSGPQFFNAITRILDDAYPNQQGRVFFKEFVIGLDSMNSIKYADAVRQQFADALAKIISGAH